MRARLVRREVTAARSLSRRHVVADRPYVPGRRNVPDRGGCVLHNAIAPEPPSVRPEVIVPCGQ